MALVTLTINSPKCLFTRDTIMSPDSFTGKDELEERIVRYRNHETSLPANGKTGDREDQPD